jgi:hypothetical protein
MSSSDEPWTVKKLNKDSKINWKCNRWFIAWILRANAHDIYYFQSCECVWTTVLLKVNVACWCHIVPLASVGSLNIRIMMPKLVSDLHSLLMERLVARISIFILSIKLSFVTLYKTFPTLQPTYSQYYHQRQVCQHMELFQKVALNR